LVFMPDFELRTKVTIWTRGVRVKFASGAFAIKRYVIFRFKDKFSKLSVPQ
jgi:hypothetical protein